jgi:hypothetical protein
MKAMSIVPMAVSLFVAATGSGVVRAQETGPAATIAWGGMAVGDVSHSPVEGAPYSATITVKSLRTLADGNQIAQTIVGATARDSQGRTREEPPVPSAIAEARQMVFIQDPVAHTAYALDLTDKTAQKMPSALDSPGGDEKQVVVGNMQAGGVAMGGAAVSTSALPSAFAVEVGPAKGGRATTEDLGSETMDGLSVTGTRTTRTIPAGQMGNAQPIKIVTEVWTSPDLKVVVYSKRSDPIMGDNTFELSNISRAEPDPSLFTLPADFKIVDDPTVRFLQPSSQN